MLCWSEAVAGQTFSKVSVHFLLLSPFILKKVKHLISSTLPQGENIYFCRTARWTLEGSIASDLIESRLRFENYISVFRLPEEAVRVSPPEDL